MRRVWIVGLVLVGVALLGAWARHVLSRSSSIDPEREAHGREAAVEPPRLSRSELPLPGVPAENAALPEDETARTSLAGSAGALVLTCTAACGTAPFGWPELAIRRGNGSAASFVRAAPVVRWDALEPGSWWLEVGGSAWMPATYELEIPAGGRLDRTIVLAPASSYRGTLADARTLEPLETAAVVASWLPAAQARAREAAWVSTELSIPEGEFCLGGPPEPAYSVRFSFGSEGYRSSDTDWFPAGPGVHVDDLIVLLERQAFARLYGVVRDAATGVPLEGTLVCAVGPEFSREQVYVADGAVNFAGVGETLAALTESERTGKSGSQGAWAIDVEAPASLRVLAIAARHRVWLSEVLELPAGLDELALDVRLEEGGLLRGRVLTDGLLSNPVPVTLELRSASNGARLSCILDAAQAFEFDGLDSGPFTATVFGAVPGAATRLPPVLLASQDVVVRAGVVTEMEIPCGSLRPGESLHGTLLFPANVEIPAAIGALCSEPELGDPCATAIAGPRGSFTLHGIPTDVEQVCVVVDGMSEDRRDRVFTVVDVEVDEALRDGLSIDLAARRLEIECGRDSRVPIGERLRLVKAGSGLAHPWLPVLLEMSASPRLEFAPGVRYRFFGLPAGDYRLQGEGCDLLFSLGTEMVSLLVD